MKFEDAIDLETVVPYEKLSLEELNDNANKIQNLFNAFLESNIGTTDILIDVNMQNLHEAIERTNKRKYYYAVFHRLKISEIKQLAILCFWFIKLKPFTVLEEESELRTDVNEVFCLFCLLSMIKALVEEQGGNYTKPNKNCIKDMVYAFKYQDITKEAMIIYFEAIASATGVNISENN